MKLTKILIPTLSLSAIVIPLSSCSCTNKQDSDHLSSLSTEYLDIDNGILKGFKDTYKDKESIPKGDYKLTIPSDITSLSANAFLYRTAADGDSMLLIQKVDAQEESSCTTISDGCFNGCSELQTVVLPSSLTTFGDCFVACSKLQTFDLTKVNKSVELPTVWTAPKDKRWPKVGTIIYKDNNSKQKELADKLLAAINDWEGSLNSWTLEKR